MRRYDVGATDEFEPGSNGRVLKNNLGIVDPIVAGRIESSLLAECYARNLTSLADGSVLDSRMILRLHEDWLKPLYPFAGELRIVNVSKDGFLFAPVAYLPRGLVALDETLAKCIPTAKESLHDLCSAIAEVHAELLLLHPFREGNGRVGRLVADMMAVQNGYRTMKWQFREPGRRMRYIAAMHRGYVTDYGPLAELVREALVEAGR